MIRYEIGYSRALNWKTLIFEDGEEKVQRAKFCAYSWRMWGSHCTLDNEIRQKLESGATVEGQAIDIAWPFFSGALMFKGQVFGGFYYGYCSNVRGNEVLRIKTSNFSTLASVVERVTGGMQLKEELFEMENPLFVPVLFEQDKAATQALIVALQEERQRLMDIANGLQAGYAGDFSLAISRRLLNVAEELAMLQQLASVQPPSGTIFENEKKQNGVKKRLEIRRIETSKTQKGVRRKPKKNEDEVPEDLPQNSLQ